jgi:DNA-binding transcriptional MocR family regulator
MGPETRAKGVLMASDAASFRHLLSTRALIPSPSSTYRPVAEPLYDFGGGFPDPASFPYDELVAATARMMKAEGAEALTYGTPQGYQALRERCATSTRCSKGCRSPPTTS